MVWDRLLTIGMIFALVSMPRCILAHGIKTSDGIQAENATTRWGETYYIICQAAK